MPVPRSVAQSSSLADTFSAIYQHAPRHGDISPRRQYGWSLPPKATRCDKREGPADRAGPSSSLFTLLRHAAATAAILHELRERQVRDALEGDVVDLPSEVADRRVGADAEAEANGLTGERRPEIEDQVVTCRERGVAADEGLPPAERIAGADEQRAAVTRIGEVADVLPPSAVAADLDHAAVEERRDAAVGFESELVIERDHERRRGADLQCGRLECGVRRRAEVEPEPGAIERHHLDARPDLLSVRPSRGPRRRRRLDRIDVRDV